MCVCPGRSEHPTRRRQGEKLVIQPPSPPFNPISSPPPPSVRTSAEATRLKFLSLLHWRIRFAPCILSLNQQVSGRNKCLLLPSRETLKSTKRPFFFFFFPLGVARP